MKLKKIYIKYPVLLFLFSVVNPENKDSMVVFSCDTIGLIHIM